MSLSVEASEEIRELVGETLNVSARSVTGRLSRIGRKLGTSDRAQMVAPSHASRGDSLDTRTVAIPTNSWFYRGSGAPIRWLAASMPLGYMRGVPASGMMYPMATVRPDWTRRDDLYLSADWHAPHVDVEYVVLGANGSLAGRAEPVTDSALIWSSRASGTVSIRRAYAGRADLRVRLSPQALEHDITAAPHDVDRVGDDEPNRRKTMADVAKCPSM